MVRPLSLAEHTLYADLLEQGADDLFDPDLPENGSLLVRGNRPGAPADHAYYQGYRPASGSNDRGKRYARYLGRADEPAVAARLARFQRAKAVRSERATTVRALIGAGMPRPDRITGRIVEALARAGLFPDDAVLLGEAAYQTYGGVLGVRLSKPAKAATGDQPAVEIAVRDRDRLGDIRDALRTVDPSFAAEPQTPRLYRSGCGVRVAVASVDRAHGTGSDPIGFLIADPVRAIVLHGPGIPVAVPAPERYAVHALITQGERSIGADDDVRAAPDRDRATELIAVLANVDRRHALVRTLADARERCPNWCMTLHDGIGTLPHAARECLSAAARSGDNSVIYR